MRATAAPPSTSTAHASGRRSRSTVARSRRSPRSSTRSTSRSTRASVRPPGACFWAPDVIAEARLVAQAPRRHVLRPVAVRRGRDLRPPVTPAEDAGRRRARPAIADGRCRIDGVDVVPDPPQTNMMHLHLRTTEAAAILGRIRRLASGAQPVGVRRRGDRRHARRSGACSSPTLMLPSRPARSTTSSRGAAARVGPLRLAGVEIPEQGHAWRKTVVASSACCGQKPRTPRTSWRPRTRSVSSRTWRRMTSSSSSLLWARGGRPRVDELDDAVGGDVLGDDELAGDVHALSAPEDGLQQRKPRRRDSPTCRPIDGSIAGDADASSVRSPSSASSRSCS